MRRLILIAVLATAQAAPVVAMQGQPPPPPPQPGTTAPAAQQPPPPTGTRLPAGQRGGRGTPGQPPGTTPAQAGRGGPSWEGPAQNIRLDVTITDSAEKSTKKVVSMLVADRDSGRIRSSNNAGVLNVDGQPRVAADGRILVSITIEYMPDRSTAVTNLHQSITLMLAPGKPTLISQSADPGTDRKVAVEVTATVVK
jgi:hypothetical protein